MKSKSVIIPMLVIILLSLALVPIVKLASAPPTFSSGGTTVVGFYSAPNYHFLAYSFNTYGQPVLGNQVNITVVDSSGTRSSTVTTNSSGLASLTLSGGSAGQVAYSVKVGAQLVTEGVFPPNVSSGESFGVAGSPLASVQDPSNSSRSDLLSFLEGPNGSLPSMFRIYYNYSSGIGPESNNPTESQMKYLGTPSSYVSIFKLPDMPPNTSSVSLAAFDSNGTLVYLTSYSIESGGGASFAPPTPSEVFTLFVSGVLALVIPLMAILVAYNSYGKDRVTGILESVLARPITRRSLGLSRYLSLVIATSVSLVVTMLVMELISKALLGDILPPTYAASTVLALIVESASFIGIMMLLSQFLRSQGSMILVGIGLWIILDFFWGVLILFASFALGIQIGSGNYLGLTIQSSFFNPAQFYSLVGEYLGGLSVSSVIGGSTPISPATYGLTPLTLGITGVFWVLAPLSAFVYYVVRRD